LESDILKALNPGLADLREFIAILEQLIAPSGFTFGTHPTWADFFLYPLVADLEATPESHILTPRIVEWSMKIKTLPAVNATVKGTLADIEG
jgi:glutathione S-transferase